MDDFGAMSYFYCCSYDSSGARALRHGNYARTPAHPWRCASEAWHWMGVDLQLQRV